MTTIVTRAGKGSPLTNTEVDTNFTNLNTAKIETLTSTDTSVTITGTGSSRDLSVPVNPNVVSGPASATDNAVARFDTTTGKLVQNSVVTVDDTGIVAGASISGASNTLSNIGNSALTNSAITINGSSTALGGSVSVGTVTSVTGTAPVVSSGGATPVISMAAATTSVPGYLTAADWTTFNNKQPAGSYLTTAVTSLTTSSGLSTNTSATGAVSVTNTGVTSIVAGTGISISGATGAVTVTNTSTGATITDDTTTNATRYILFDDITSGSLTAVNVSSTKLFFNPSTGTLTSTVHTSNSDERLKENWTDVAPDFIEKLAKVKSGVFSRIDSGNREAGVTAQSLQTVLPESVVAGADGYLSVNYGGAALVAAIELAKVVEELRAEIAMLKAKVGE